MQTTNPASPLPSLEQNQLSATSVHVPQGMGRRDEACRRGACAFGVDVICSEHSITLTFNSECGAHVCTDVWQCSCARSS